MEIKIRAYEPKDAAAARIIWNQVVKDGDAFPQEDTLAEAEGNTLFESQTYTGIAEDADSGDVVGLYILHPNNVGRCSHIANASYAVKKDLRGAHIGEKLVKDCLQQAKLHGFRILQFNAVVAGNIHAQHLYERLGFTKLGRIPEGFRLPDGTYDDIFVYYCLLENRKN